MNNLLDLSPTLRLISQCPSSLGRTGINWDANVEAC